MNNQPVPEANSVAGYSFDLVRKCYWMGNTVLSASQVCSGLAERDALRDRVVVAERDALRLGTENTFLRAERGRDIWHNTSDAIEEVQSTLRAAYLSKGYGVQESREMANSLIRAIQSTK